MIPDPVGRQEKSRDNEVGNEKVEADGVRVEIRAV